MELITTRAETGYSTPASVEIQIPKFCPRCGAGNNPTNLRQTMQAFSDGNVYYFSHQCPLCKQFHFTIQQGSSEQSTKLHLLTVYPNTSSQKFSEQIESFSPRFVSVFNQAYRSEQRGDLTIAGIGYRAAMEILVKDYAFKHPISEDTEDTKQKVAHRNLYRTLDKYFKDDDVLKAGDVVRDRGDDYAHWEHPDDFDEKYELELMKRYLSFVVEKIDTKLWIENAPYKRN